MPTEQSEIKFTEVKDVSADSIMTLNEPIYKTLVKNNNNNNKIITLSVNIYSGEIFL